METKNVTPVNTKVSIPHPCRMRVAELSANGFNCSLCHKTVTDFRGKSLDEIRTTLQNSPGEVCGIYSMEHVNLSTSHEQMTPGGQRNRPQIRGKMRRFLFALAAIFIPTFSIHAAPHTHDAGKPSSRDIYLPALKNAGETILSGIVKDTEGKEMRKVFVWVKRDGQIIGYAETNSDGYFEVRLPGDDFMQGEISISFEKKDHDLGHSIIADPENKVCREFEVTPLAKAKKLEKYYESVVGWGT